MKRHFRINAISNFTLAKANILIRTTHSEYIFTSNGNVNMGNEMGVYDIFVDSNKDVESEYDKYEIFELNREEYEEYRTYRREKHNLVNRVEMEKKMDAERLEMENDLEMEMLNMRSQIMNELANNHQKEIEDIVEKRVKKEIEDGIREFKIRFANEQATYDDLCTMYRKKIDYEVKLRKKNSQLSPFDHSLVDVEIRKFKNNLVDGIVKTTLAKRGERDYWEVMKNAGKLADMIESQMWNIKIK